MEAEPGSGLEEPWGRGLTTEENPGAERGTGSVISNAPVAPGSIRQVPAAAMPPPSPFLGQDKTLRCKARSGARRAGHGLLSPVLSGQPSLHFGRIEKTEAAGEWDDGPRGERSPGFWALLDRAPGSP